MKKYFENVFACTYAGYKQSEKDEPWKTDSVGRAIVILIIEQAGFLFIFTSLIYKLFKLKSDYSQSTVSLISFVTLFILWILNNKYFTSELCESHFQHSNEENNRNKSTFVARVKSQ